MPLRSQRHTGRRRRPPRGMLFHWAATYMLAAKPQVMMLLTHTVKCRAGRRRRPPRGVSLKPVLVCLLLTHCVMLRLTHAVLMPPGRRWRSPRGSTGAVPGGGGTRDAGPAGPKRRGQDHHTAHHAGWVQTAEPWLSAFRWHTQQFHGAETCSPSIMLLLRRTVASTGIAHAIMS